MALEAFWLRLELLTAGHIYSDMQSADHDNRKLQLLSTVELDEVAEIVGQIVVEQLGASAVAILLWDKDLESFADKFLLGPHRKDLSKVCDAFAQASEPPQQIMSELELGELNVSIDKDLEPVLCFRLAKDAELVAVLLIAGSDDEPSESAEKLEQFAFCAALYNSWQFLELRRENDRLRAQYEDMEKEVSVMEEQTRKLITDITMRDSIRTRQVMLEGLVYSISNAVRSSVDIQRVLQTVVEQIGTAFSASRCLILRAVDSVEQLNVFEFTRANMQPVQQLFFSPQGLQFAHEALLQTIPHEVSSVGTSVYNSDFLKTLSLHSGLIVPLVLRDRTLGALFIQHCEAPWDWSMDQISLIGSLADQMSVAIENADLHQERERQAITDGLTGVANRRSFNETFTREFERARRYGEPLSLVIVDLDFLKKINDTYGHQTGDEAIKTIGKLLKQSSRSVDLPARYGGEEFCLLLPNTEIEMAEQLADRLRRLINEVEVEGPGRISASLGIANYPLHADEPDILFQRADEALYVAKQNGRNQVRIAIKPPPPLDQQSNNGGHGTSAGSGSSRVVN